MGAKKKMRCIIACLVLVAFAASHEIAPEDILLEVTTEVSDLKKKGATEADCKDLAVTTCNEVLKDRSNSQTLLDSLKSGKHCVTLGQSGVRKALAHYHRTKRTWMQMKVKVTTASRASVSIS